MPFCQPIWLFTSGTPPSSAYHTLTLIRPEWPTKRPIFVDLRRKRGAFLSLVKPGSMANWLSEEPRSLLRAMSMTVCDLSAITKPWPIEKRVADLVSSEFFEQGDMERHELNITPIVSVARPASMCSMQFTKAQSLGQSKANTQTMWFFSGVGHYES